MALFLVNVEIEKQIKEIKQKIVLSMNGVTSDNMKKYGIKYKQNYGVSIILLRKIATLYKPSYDLAQQLWNTEVRECMILATLLEPAEKFDKKIAEKWMEKVDNIELAEQIAINLLPKTLMATKLVFEWIGSNSIWTQITACLLGIRIYPQFNMEQTKKIIDIILSKSETEEFHLYKTIALFLSRLTRSNDEIRRYMEEKVNSFSSSENTGKKYIYNEVKEEILFLKNIPE